MRWSPPSRWQGLAESVVAVDERGPNREPARAHSGEKLPKAKFVPASGILRNIRAVKTEEELQRVTDALRITEAGFNAAVAIFKEGASEKDLQAAFERTVTEQGGRTGFCLVRSGVGVALGQIPASPDIRLKANDFAFFDMGIKYRGYQVGHRPDGLPRRAQRRTAGDGGRVEGGPAGRRST